MNWFMFLKKYSFYVIATCLTFALTIYSSASITSLKFYAVTALFIGLFAFVISLVIIIKSAYAEGVEYQLVNSDKQYIYIFLCKNDNNVIIKKGIIIASSDRKAEEDIKKYVGNNSFSISIKRIKRKAKI